MIFELDLALGEMRDALTSTDSATYFLPSVVFPALQAYMDNHFAPFFDKLGPTSSIRTAVLSSLTALGAKLNAFNVVLRRLEDTDMAAGVRAERK